MNKLAGKNHLLSRLIELLITDSGFSGYFFGFQPGKSYKNITGDDAAEIGDMWLLEQKRDKLGPFSLLHARNLEVFHWIYSRKLSHKGRRIDYRLNSAIMRAAIDNNRLDIVQYLYYRGLDPVEPWKRVSNEMAEWLFNNSKIQLVNTFIYHKNYEYFMKCEDNIKHSRLSTAINAATDPEGLKILKWIAENFRKPYSKVITIPSIEIAEIVCKNIRTLAGYCSRNIEVLDWLEKNEVKISDDSLWMAILEKNEEMLSWYEKRDVIIRDENRKILPGKNPPKKLDFLGCYTMSNTNIDKTACRWSVASTIVSHKNMEVFEWICQTFKIGGFVSSGVLANPDALKIILKYIPGRLYDFEAMIRCCLCSQNRKSLDKIMNTKTIKKMTVDYRYHRFDLRSLLPKLFEENMYISLQWIYDNFPEQFPDYILNEFVCVKK